MNEESKFERESREARSRAFESLPANAVCGWGGPPRAGIVQVRAREWRLRRAVELLREASDVGISQAMLADLVRNPSDSPLWTDLSAIGATSSLEKRADKRGVEREQRVWRLQEERS
jgi:hypothetical protein